MGRSLGSLDLPLEFWLDNFGRALVACYEEAARRAGKLRWADKNPENCINIHHWHRLLDGRLCFVLLLRDPLDVLASMKEAAMNLTYGATLPERVEHIHRYLRSALDYAEAESARTCVVRYEALVTQPQATLAALLHRLGERFDVTALARVNDPAHGQGLEDPKVRTRTAPQLDSVGRWRTDLSRDEVETLGRALRALMPRLRWALGTGGE